ncbi:hypothetical protein [Roseobacter sp. CCS2]|uniref:hypothetical protein n=1 Tax=Roseobacter sp. CCS2 TaxID=391593 RepID=UPI0000F3E477|nr:hypothetical protein [Roseobacter sp. CCS2]EBA12023.1 hypothetical protein RCCS2_12039 [Roseobacter sp. CCS2]
MAQQPTTNKAREAEGLTQGEAIAIAFAVGWMVVIGIFFWRSMSQVGPDGGFFIGRWVLAVIAVFIPAALIWIATLLARTARHLREDLYATQAEVSRLSGALATQQSNVAAPAGPAISPPQNGSTAIEASPSGFSSRREVSRLIVPRAAPQAPVDQPTLALDTPPEDTTPPVNRPDFIMALNFPDDENDTEGFAALRRALRDRGARKLVQASQDVLTLLSQDGIYMDDLRPPPAPADLWRSFAKGARGKSVDRLGGIKEQAYLSLVSKRTREDTIFRDSVHHFLRCFDQMLVSFEEHATDTDLLELAETRTARAFMLLGRSTGTFD